MLIRILPTVVGIGFCVIAVFKIIFLVDSSPAPDAASGHTEPALFAPAISTDWSYITPTQILILIVVTGTVLLLAALMVGLKLHDRFFDGGGDDDEADIEAAVRPSPPAPVARKGRAFGLRSGARRL